MTAIVRDRAALVGARHLLRLRRAARARHAEPTGAIGGRAARLPVHATLAVISTGPNLYHDVRADYAPTRITADDLFDILQGRTSADTPKVLGSGPTDDVYVYMAGHGNQNGLYLGLGDVVPAQNQRYSVVSPAALQGAVDAMAARHQYRRLLVAVEACEGGVLGENLDAPGTLLLSAAGPIEDSLSANYDASLDTWLGHDVGVGPVPAGVPRRRRLAPERLWVAVRQPVGGADRRVSQRLTRPSVSSGCSGRGRRSPS